jgi:hypothetical protein
MSFFGGICLISILSTLGGLWLTCLLFSAKAGSRSAIASDIAPRNDGVKGALQIGDSKLYALCF